MVAHHMAWRGRERRGEQVEEVDGQGEVGDELAAGDEDDDGDGPGGVSDAMECSPSPAEWQIRR